MDEQRLREMGIPKWLSSATIWLASASIILYVLRGLVYAAKIEVPLIVDIIIGVIVAVSVIAMISTVLKHHKATGRWWPDDKA